MKKKKTKKVKEVAQDLLDRKITRKMVSDPARDAYQISIPTNATKEEIDEFMKKFKEKWFSKPNELASKPDEE